MQLKKNTDSLPFPVYHIFGNSSQFRKISRRKSQRMVMQIKRLPSFSSISGNSDQSQKKIREKRQQMLLLSNERHRNSFIIFSIGKLTQ